MKNADLNSALERGATRLPSLHSTDEYLDLALACLSEANVRNSHLAKIATLLFDYYYQEESDVAP